jgi:mRNA-degrading endonuclease HigB of HigAB toxin-antitoxin module
VTVTVSGVGMIPATAGTHERVLIDVGDKIQQMDYKTPVNLKKATGSRSDVEYFAYNNILHRIRARGRR